MLKMRAAYIGLVLLQLLSLTTGVCVLESEFGFILNCNFKKSGLFRVRNLGGLKAHFGLGFSFGDELGFSESLGNLEGNRKRALNYKTTLINKVGDLPPKIDMSTKSAFDLNHNRSFNRYNNTTSMTEVMFLPLGVPVFRPIPTTDNSDKRRTNILPPSGTMGLETKSLSTFDRDSLCTAKDIMCTYNGSKNISNKIGENIQQIHKNQIIKKFDFPKMDHEKNNAKIQLQVMNAPKEYYPSGYDKNFDDNFKSKVKLPANGFKCNEQKYFPGLYTNIELGCMVFHVCAISEDKIVMKSFLCPESTLFDQSILKCNWWFYVECDKSTYDSNIPVVKSYQLMKSISNLSNVTKI